MPTFRRRGAACIAVLACLVAPAAHAVQVTFEFTGSMRATSLTLLDGAFSQDFSVAGQLVSGSMTFVTEGLLPLSTVDSSGARLSFRDTALDAVQLVSSTLVINGSSFDTAQHLFDAGNATLLAGAGLTGDSFSLTQTSTDLNPSGNVPLPVGSIPRTALSLQWFAPATPQDYVDLTGIDTAEALLAHPFGTNGVGRYALTTLTCDGEGCTFAPEFAYNFDITSISRRVASVPEPSTAALLLAGMIVGAAARRRRSRDA